MTALLPTPKSERLHALDAMRGLAILGVLLAYTVWSLGAPPEDTWSRVDHVIARGMDLLVDTKFLTMFACLFGVGVAQQWRRWEASGQPIGPLHVRRMTFLLIVGLVHGALLRNGDILAPYAILGLLLLGGRTVPNRQLAAVAVLLLFVPPVVNALASAAGWAWPSRPSAPAGNYVTENLAWLRYWYVTNPLRAWPIVLAVMLAGVLIGRGGVLERLAFDRAAAGRVLAVSLALAVFSRLALDGLGGEWSGSGMSSAQRLTLNYLYRINAWALAATYGAAILVLSQVRGVDWALAPLRSLGRMAFTSYLLQAIVIVPICLAFGLFDRVSPIRGLVMAAALGALQAGFSAWWLRDHAMGPLERVWRRVTYGAVSP